jgi:hypothetical protein
LNCFLLKASEVSNRLIFSIYFKINAKSLDNGLSDFVPLQPDKDLLGNYKVILALLFLHKYSV